MLKAVAIVLFLSVVGYAAAEDSGCLEDREKRINSTIDATESPMLHLIPECDENGDYAALQCFTEKPWCVCYRRDGRNINTPSRKLKACDCIRAADDAKADADAYVPKCKKDGTYAAKQCVMQECWCVDESGKAITDPTSDLWTCE